MGIKFKCPKNGSYGEELVDIEIPKYCPTCGFTFKVDYNGDGIASQFDMNCCNHVNTYGQVWNIRLIHLSDEMMSECVQATEFGATCVSCNEYAPHAHKDESFKCWSCKTYPHYR
jgi:hypothetical protein